MSDTQRTAGLLQATRLELTDQEKERFCRALDDFLALASKLDNTVSNTDRRQTLGEDEMREDKSFLSDVQPSDILKLSEGATEKYIAVPITVEQQ